MKSKIIHGLFYWNQNSRYVFSRTKFLSVVTFIVLFISLLDAPPISFAFIFSLLFAGIVFIIGLIVHKLAHIDSGFYSGKLSDDVKHFMFYWHDRSNGFKLSKTKIITVIIIVMGFIAALDAVFKGEAGAFGLGFIIVFVVIALIAFLIGLGIHKLISDDEDYVPVDDHMYAEDAGLKDEKNEDFHGVVSPELSNHLTKAEELKKEYDVMESKTKELIAAKFAPPQITYDRFMAVVANCSKIFNEEYDSAVSIIRYANDDSEKIETEINSKMANMESIMGKLDELSSELVINMSKTDDEDMHSVLNDMESLISSIRNYED